MGAAFINRGNVYAGKGQQDQAIHDYDQAIRLNPNDVAAFTNRGTVYNDKSQFDSAIQDLDQAIHLDPKNAVAFHNRGRAYANKAQLDRAIIQDYDQAIRLDPKFATAFNSRGLAKEARGDSIGRDADFAKAKQLNPSAGNTAAQPNAAQMLPNEYQQVSASSVPLRVQYLSSLPVPKPGGVAGMAKVTVNQLVSIERSIIKIQENECRVSLLLLIVRPLSAFMRLR